MSKSSITTADGAPMAAVPAPTFTEAFKTWSHIGLLSFGGPTAQIALMHRIVVEEKKWLTEQQFINALGFCMLLPGPEAMQLATYAGWRMHGVRGGLAAGLMFVLPGALVVLALSAVYAAWGNVPLVEAIFFGIKAAVLIIVVEALLRIAKRALKKNEHWLIAALAFVAIFFGGLPFPLIVAAAALWGYLRTTDQTTLEASTHPEIRLPAGTARASLKTIMIWLVIWATPLVAIAAILGPTHILAQLGWFFSKLAVVTFGGAYAVLAYMAQDVVQKFNWLEPTQMLDGLGLAETTPGPLILVTEFVGYLAAYRSTVGGSWMIGGAGAAVALWATFAPCFLWIFAGAPYIEWIGSRQNLKSALAAITAAVVGVILNLTVWFALHVFFKTVTETKTGPLTLWMPDLATLDWRALAIAAVSSWLLLMRHWSIGWVLAIAAALGLLQRIVGI